MDAILNAAAALLGQLAPKLATSGVVALLSKIAPSLSTSGGVEAALKLLASILPKVPAAIELAQEEIPIIKSVIATLRGNSATTAAQMDALDAFDARCDAILDAAIAAAEAADKAAGATS